MVPNAVFRFETLEMSSMTKRTFRRTGAPSDAVASDHARGIVGLLGESPEPVAPGWGDDGGEEKEFGEGQVDLRSAGRGLLPVPRNGLMAIPG